MHLPIGYKIGNHYKITEVLGQGGFGIVYLVKDLERLDEIVVIKELFVRSFSIRHKNGKSVSNKANANTIFQKIKKDIIKEVNILKKIKNKNIVKAHGYLQENNTIYSIMEFIEGEDLEKYKKKNSFNENEAKELLRQFISGLKEIHKAKIIHRDIKPSNIIKTQSGLYKLIDFTTSRTYSQNQVTLTGFRTKGYTPPELEQTKAIIGNYSDIYSIGMTLFNLLSQQEPPLIADRYKNNEFFQDIDMLNISSKFKRVIKKMTTMNIKDRFQNLEEIEKILFKEKNIKIITEINIDKEINSSTTHSKPKDLNELDFDSSQKNTDKQSNSWFKKAFIPLLFLAVLAYGGYKNREYISNFVEDLTTYLKQLGSKEFNDGNVKKFIEDFTQAEETNWAEKTLPYFANQLDNYYGTKDITKDKIHKKKITVNSDYLNHKYRLLSVEIMEKGAKYCKIIRRVRYKSKLKTSKILSGVAIDSITLKKSNNTFQITSIYRMETQKDIPPKKKKPVIISKEFNRKNIEPFLKEFIASGESDSAEKVLPFYALKVERYFNWTDTTRDKIYEDKRKFFKKWTYRKYELIDFTILDKYSKNGVNYCTLTNKIKWKAKSSSKSNSGVTINSIKLKSENDSFKIVSIYSLSNDIDSTPILTPFESFNDPIPKPIVTLEFNYQNIKNFLKDFLSTKEGNSAENIANYFSATVDNLYGIYSQTTNDIVQRKQNWMNKWKSRQFGLVNFKILRTYSKDGIEYCDLKEIENWKHQKLDSSEYISGTSKKGITIKKSSNGFKITSIYVIKNSIVKNFNRDNIKKFLKDFLRTKEGNSAKDIANYFSYRVENYYGTYNKTTDYITERKKDWIAMWKSRHFELVSFEILRTYSKDGIEYCDLKESVEWRHSKNDSTIQTGTSKILMTLKKENGDFKIISINNTN